LGGRGLTPLSLGHVGGSDRVDEESIEFTIGLQRQQIEAQLPGHLQVHPGRPTALAADPPRLGQQARPVGEPAGEAVGHTQRHQRYGMPLRSGRRLQGQRLLAHGDLPVGLGRVGGEHSAQTELRGPGTSPAGDDRVVVDLPATHVQPVDDPVAVSAGVGGVGQEQGQLRGYGRLGQPFAEREQRGRPATVEEPLLSGHQQLGGGLVLARILQAADRVVDAAVFLEPAGRPSQHVALLALGTVPFAALAWTSVVPLLLTVEAFAIAAVVTARDNHLTRTCTPAGRPTRSSPAVPRSSGSACSTTQNGGN
jgi:hypothetical protein